MVSFIFFPMDLYFHLGWSGFFDFNIFGMKHFPWSSAWINIVRADNLYKKDAQPPNFPTAAETIIYVVFLQQLGEEPQLIKPVKDIWKVSTYHLVLGREQTYGECWKWPVVSLVIVIDLVAEKIGNGYTKG